MTGCGVTSTCSNSRKMLSSLSEEIPQPVSDTTISTATFPTFRRPSGSSKARHWTDMLPSFVYFTEPKRLADVGWEENVAGRTSICCQVCNNGPNLPGISDHRPWTSTYVNVELQTSSRGLVSVNKCSLSNNVMQVKRFVERCFVPAFQPRKIQKVINGEQKTLRCRMRLGEVLPRLHIQMTVESEFEVAVIK